MTPDELQAEAPGAVEDAGARVQRDPQFSARQRHALCTIDAARRGAGARDAGNVLQQRSDVAAKRTEQGRLEERIGDQMLLPDVVEADVGSRSIDHRFVSQAVEAQHFDAGVSEVDGPGDGRTGPQLRRVLQPRPVGSG